MIKGIIVFFLTKGCQKKHERNNTLGSNVDYHSKITLTIFKTKLVQQLDENYMPLNLNIFCKKNLE